MGGPDGKSIAQIAATDDGSLWTFLSQLPASTEAQMFYALMMAGTVGMAAHYIVKWARKEIDGSLFAYLFRDNPRGTLLSFCTYTGLAIAAIYADAFHVGDTRTFVGWGMVLWLGAFNGFTIDAIANKGQRPVWTPSKRRQEQQA